MGLSSLKILLTNRFHYSLVLCSQFLKKSCFFFPFLYASLFAFDDQTYKKMGDTHEGSQVLFLIHHGQIKEALENYLEFCQKYETQDIDLLRLAALQILEQGADSKDPEIQLLSIFGAGIAANSDLITILEKGLASEHGNIQLASLNFLAKLQDDEAEDLIFTALSSPFLIVRLEAALHLAQSKHPKVLGQIESLMCKTPAIIKPVYPQIIACINSPSATKMLRQFFTDQDANVRIETILYAAETERDDFLPQIRSLAAHPDIAEQEACALALGVLKDETSMPLLRKMTTSCLENVALAACYSLYLLGDYEKIDEILTFAARGYPFAIYLLGEIQSDDEKISKLLHQFVRHKDLNIRINASYALLKRKDPLCIESLKEILITDSRDILFREFSSSGRSLKALKVMPGSLQRTKDSSSFYASSLHLREKMLRLCYHLPDSAFMDLAKYLFIKNQFDLIPTTVELLRNKQSIEAIELLKQQQQRAGAPLIRNYCNLALFKLNEPGPYEDNLKKWVKEKQDAELIRFRDVIPKTQLQHSAAYLLTPEETSRLLVESFEALASTQNEAGIQAIIKAIAYGNAKNKYALAGLLLKTTE